MGFYYDRTTGHLFQNDRAMDKINPRRYVRHEPIPPCTCPQCLNDEKTIIYFPCHWCGYQMPPKVPKEPGDFLNRTCPKCGGMCDRVVASEADAVLRERQFWENRKKQ